MRALAECTVLVVEDNELIAWDIEEALREGGCERVHVAASVDLAKMAIHQFVPTIAVLDVDLGQENSFPIADMLASMRIPFFFLTAKNVETLPIEHRSRELMGKPYAGAELIKKILELVNPREPVDEISQGRDADDPAMSADLSGIIAIPAKPSEE
jgi:DNA-binding response OmpR family regulator